MGAHDFTDFAEAETVKDAYSKCVEEARYQYGSDGYNGTITTTRGFKMLRRDPVPRAVADRLNAAAWDAEERGARPFEKWGHCAALAICKDTDWKWKSVTKTVTVEGRYMSDADLLAAMGLKDEPNVVIAEREEVGTKVTVEAKNTPGDAVTRYYIEGVGVPLRARDEGYPTQAAARKAAVEMAKRGAEPYIIGKRTREDGSPLVRVKPTIRHRVKVKAKIGTPKPGAKIVGGYFFGLAAS